MSVMSVESRLGKPSSSRLRAWRNGRRAEPKPPELWVRLPPPAPCRVWSGMDDCGLNHIRAGLARLWLNRGSARIWLNRWRNVVRAVHAPSRCGRRPILSSQLAIAELLRTTAGLCLESGRSAWLWLQSTLSATCQRTRRAARIWLNRRHGYALLHND